jgi:DHA2 family multidrug resistance protein
MVHQNAQHRADLTNHLDIHSPTVNGRVEMYEGAFESKGRAENVAKLEAYKALDYTVTKQAAVRSYMDVFLYIGILFLLCIPFVLVVKGKKDKDKGGGDMGEHMH